MNIDIDSNSKNNKYQYYFYIPSTNPKYRIYRTDGNGVTFWHEIDKAWIESVNLPENLLDNDIFRPILDEEVALLL